MSRLAAAGLANPSGQGVEFVQGKLVRQNRVSPVGENALICI